MSVIDFAFSICKVLRVFLKHCKDMEPKKHYAYLPVLVNQILRFIEPQQAMIGDMLLCVEKKIPKM